MIADDAVEVSRCQREQVVLVIGRLVQGARQRRLQRVLIFQSGKATMFFKLFGLFYFADGVLGLLTGSGYLDFGIFIRGVLDLPLSTRIFANAPHLGLGGLAILIGYVLTPITRPRLAHA